MISVEKLGRYFGPVKAVDGITFKVERGEVLGFLGPNGAGKSTTMKMLTSFLTPSFGKAFIGGFDVVEQSIESRKLFGYLPENAPLYGEMTPKEFLSFIGEMRGLAGAKFNTAFDRVVGLTGVGPVLDRKIETLSKGFKRRVGLCQALIHDPQVLILDEPTDGLDPNQKHEVRTLINQMASEKCIILSTHILEEVDACCTRVVVISSGKIVADSNPDDLRARAKSFGALTVTLAAKDQSHLRKELEAINGVGEVRVKSAVKGSTFYTLIPKKGQDILKSFLNESEKKQWKVDSMKMETGHLDEVFRDLTEGNG